MPHRWCFAGANGKPPRESNRYERTRVTGLAPQNAIRDARTEPAARDNAPAATVSATARADEHSHDQEAVATHALDHRGPDAALTPAQRAAAVHAHQQAAMPKEYLEGRTTDPATWMRTLENLDRLATITRAANVHRREIEDREFPAAAPADPHRQEPGQQPPAARGVGTSRHPVRALDDDAVHRAHRCARRRWRALSTRAVRAIKCPVVRWWAPAPLKPVAHTERDEHRCRALRAHPLSRSAARHPGCPTEGKQPLTSYEFSTFPLDHAHSRPGDTAHRSELRVTGGEISPSRTVSDCRTSARSAVNSRIRMRTTGWECTTPCAQTREWAPLWCASGAQ
ncbi:hypothetical protein AB0N62_41680 [Streptomyces sp. NPDC093982]|uniref:hypothetical protein n=1 Tax=Streptomyces sp. NPDC093982 TaxID=3155077 RepID=UPI003423C925